MSTFAATQSHLSPNADAADNAFHPSVLLIFAHLPLGILLKQFPYLGFIHCFVVICFGLNAAWHRKTEVVAYLCAYIAGSEVLWRMTTPSLFWELGKYAIIAIMGLFMFRGKLRGMAPAPLIALLLLLPAAFLTTSQTGLWDARGEIAFNTGAYFVLVFCAGFFRPLNINREELKQLLFALILPAVSIASIALYGTLTAEKIRFVNDSNFQLSGGYGPNQVSSILGLACFASSLLFLLRTGKRGIGLLFGLLCLWFGFQTIMTFSRGGLYCAVGAMACLIGWIRDTQIRKRILLVGIPALLLSLLIIFPRLDQFTGGKLTTRFEDTDTTNRATLMQEEIAIWSEHFVFGVGIGEAKFNRATQQGASHSEFSRLLAEHGVFGVMIMITIAISVVFNTRRASTLYERSLIVAFAFWAVLFTFTAALRLAAPAWMLGLSYARFDLLEENHAGEIALEENGENHP